MHLILFRSHVRFNINFKRGNSSRSRNSGGVFTNTDDFDIDSDRLLGLFCTELAYDVIVLKGMSRV